MDFATASIELDPRKVGVMFSILFVSLFAVSFPTLSKLLPFLRIPTVVFFIGKHFGTGVILATAFIHLLDDAFRSLQSTKVEHHYPGLGKWTGFIILASLLSIFLVEYISTSYVEQLQDDPSAPPTPAPSTPRSRSRSPGAKISTLLITEHTPLLTTTHPVRRHTTDPHNHHLSDELTGVPVAVLNNSPRICRLAIAHDHVNGHHHHEHSPHEEYGLDSDFQEHQNETPHPRIGRRRQIIGILVLQLGIMIHSLVIGMTLAITSGSEFTSLTTAVIFHQLFEGLSLGIRIAALPDASSKQETEDETGAGAGAVEGESVDDVESGRAASAERRRTSPPWYHLRAHFAELHWFKPTLSLLFGVTTPLGMAMGMVLWPTKTPIGGGAKMLVVQGVMSAISAGMLIYAATVEMLAADFVFGDVEGGTHHHHHHDGGHEHEHAHDHHDHHRQRQLVHDHERSDQEPNHTRQRNGAASAQAAAAAAPPCPCPSPSPIPAYWTTGDGPRKAAKQRKKAAPVPSPPPTPAPIRDLPAAQINGNERQNGSLDSGEGSDEKNASMGKRLLAVFSLLAGVGMMVLVGLGE